MRALASPIRLPTSALAAGGNAPISRLAREIAERSPKWVSRATLSDSKSAAVENAAIASTTIASTDSELNAETCFGSNDLLGADNLCLQDCGNE